MKLFRASLLITDENNEYTKMYFIAANNRDEAQEWVARKAENFWGVGNCTRHGYNEGVERWAASYWEGPRGQHIEIFCVHHVTYLDVPIYSGGGGIARVSLAIEQPVPKGCPHARRRQ